MLIWDQNYFSSNSLFYAPFLSCYSLTFLSLAPHTVFIDSTKAHGCDSNQVGCDIVGEYPPRTKGSTTYYEFIFNHGSWRRHGIAATQVCHRHRSAGKDQNGVDIIKTEKNSRKSCPEFYNNNKR